MFVFQNKKIQYYKLNLTNCMCHVFQSQHVKASLSKQKTLVQHHEWHNVVITSCYTCACPFMYSVITMYNADRRETGDSIILNTQVSNLISEVVLVLGLSPPVKYLTDRSKAVLLLWIFYVYVLSCVCYVFVRVCLYVLCGHLLGKG